MATPLPLQTKKWIAVFPGQGSQVVSMGKSLFENFALVKHLFEEASDSVGLNIKKLCFDGPEADLTLTQNAQPCLLTVSVAAYRVFESLAEPRPTCFAGHSLGEYSALVASGGLTFSRAAKLVHKRGQAMQLAVPVGQGAMAAIMGLSDESVTTLCKEAQAAAKAKRGTRAIASESDQEIEWRVDAVCEPANYNTPSQTVIAGSVDAIHEALEFVKTDDRFNGGKGVLLQVSAPFHSSLMAPARDAMAQLSALESSNHSTLKYPYIANCTGRLVSESSVIYELLTQQVDHPVLWKQSMQAAQHSGIEHLVEFGPQKVLQGLSKRCNPQMTFQGINDLETIKGATA